MTFHRATIFVGLAAVLAAGCASGPAASPSGTASAIATATGAPATAGANGSPSGTVQATGPAATPRFSIDPFYSGFETIGFGTGGEGCTIATIGRTFGPDDPIRVNAEYSPALPAGTTVTIRLSVDGVEAAGYPVQVAFAVDTRCVFGSVSPGTLEPGHYTLEVAPDSAPAVSGSFDIH